LTVLAISQIVATPIAATLFFIFGLPAICCLQGGSYTVELPAAIIALTSLVANFSGAILLLLKRIIGLYLSALGLAIWMFFAFVMVIFGFPLIAVPIMIAELVLGWNGIRSTTPKVS